MWVDDFLKEQAGRLEVMLTLGDLDTGGQPRLRGPELTFQQMERIAIEQQGQRASLGQEDIIEVKEEELPLASINTKVDLSNSCLTISKISRSSMSPDKVPDTPPSISLIRITKASTSPSTTMTSSTASILLKTVAARAAASEHDLEDDCLEIVPKSSPSKPTLSFKHPCPQCDMSFPTAHARILHQEVCQHPQKVTFLSPPSPVSQRNEEPPRKRKRPPPPLIPL